MLWYFLRQRPFWADNHHEMHLRVLNDELQFPDDREMDEDTKHFIRGVNHCLLFNVSIEC